MTNRNDLASAVARHVRANLGHLDRGAGPVHLSATEPAGVAVFGNDGYASDPRVRREVRLLRFALEEAGLDEMGFGLDEEGQTWALLIGADSELAWAVPRGRSPNGQLESFLGEAVWAAWRVACGLPPVPAASASQAPGIASLDDVGEARA